MLQTQRFPRNADIISKAATPTTSWSLGGPAEGHGRVRIMSLTVFSNTAGFLLLQGALETAPGGGFGGTNYTLDRTQMILPVAANQTVSLDFSVYGLDIINPSICLVPNLADPDWLDNPAEAFIMPIAICAA